MLLQCIAKMGKGPWNIGCSNMAALVRGLTFSNKLFGNFLITFQITISTGQAMILEYGNTDRKGKKNC